MITLVENGFTRPQMAEIVGVSLSTICRRMAICQCVLNILLSDAELDTIIHEIKKESSQPVAISKC